MRIKSCAYLCVAALLLATASIAAAQEFRATVRGQVLDSSKGALPGATVSITNTETGEVATATTNTEGNFTLPFLRPGQYTLTVELSGFQKHTRSGMTLAVNETATINVALAVGGVTEEVTVSGESPLLETSNASRGTVIDSARIAELPLQSRSPMALVVLVAGVNYNAQAVYLRPFDNGALAAWSMNGGAEQQQRVPPRRRAEQRQPGRQQHRLRAAGGSRAGNEDLHQLVRRAVRPDRRRRRQHVAQVGDELLPRRSLRLHAPQGPGRQLVPPQLAPVAEDRSVHRSVRVQRRRAHLQEQDVLPVHRREVPGRHARAPVRRGADAGDEDRRLQRSRGRPGQPDPDLRPGDRPRRRTAPGRAIRSRATRFLPTASIRRRRRS